MLLNIILRVSKQRVKFYSPDSSFFKISQKFYKKIYPIQSMSTTSDKKPEVVFVLGGPGAGKGTQCKKIVDTFGFVHLSAGDLLREERARAGSQFGELIENHIKNGKIVPVAVTCSLIENAMNDYMKKMNKNKFLIDGFPRNQDNLDGWTEKMSDKVDLKFVLFFDCDEQICVTRCLKRGQTGSGRSDDNEESMRKRIITYTEDSFPIIEHYMNLKQVKRIDANKTAEEIFNEVRNVFNELQDSKVYGDN